jgi:GT2 family glycosyltransferase
LPLLRRVRRIVGEYPSPERLLSSREPVPVDYVWGAALVARTSFLREIGGLDERFFMYHEDEDLGRQARRLGRRVLLVTRARAGHTGGVSSVGMRPLEEARLLFATWQLLTKWRRGSAARSYRLLLPVPLQIRRTAACALGDRRRAGETQATIRLLRLFFAAGRVR